MNRASSLASSSLAAPIPFSGLSPGHRVQRSPPSPTRVVAADVEIGPGGRSGRFQRETKDLVTAMSGRVHGQDAAKWALATGIGVFRYAVRGEGHGYCRQNILLAGPRSCGMSSLVSSALEASGLRWHTPDLTEFLDAGGSVGLTRNLNEMLLPLFADGFGAPRSPLGAIVLEDLDQFAVTHPSNAARHEALQSGLVRLARGKEVMLPCTNGRMAKVDTRRVLFIATLQGPLLAQAIEKRHGWAAAGFGSRVEAAEEKHLFRQFGAPDLIACGLDPALVAAFERRAGLHHLDADDLVAACLLQPGLLARLRDLFAMAGVLLEIGDDALDDAARRAGTARTGVRGLVEVLGGALEPALVEVGEREDGVQKVVLRSLDHPAELVPGPSLCPMMRFQADVEPEDNLPPEWRARFPRECLRRPPRQEAASGEPRLAREEDLASWMEKEIA